MLNDIAHIVRKKCNDMHKMSLNNGEHMQEEYKEYCPYDGCGYNSVHVKTDLNFASTISGERYNGYVPILVVHIHYVFCYIF